MSKARAEPTRFNVDPVRSGFENHDGAHGVVLLVRLFLEGFFHSSLLFFLLFVPLGYHINELAIF